MMFVCRMMKISHESPNHLTATKGKFTSWQWSGENNFFFSFHCCATSAAQQWEELCNRSRRQWMGWKKTQLSFEPFSEFASGAVEFNDEKILDFRLVNHFFTSTQDSSSCLNFLNETPFTSQSVGLLCSEKSDLIYGNKWSYFNSHIISPFPNILLCCASFLALAKWLSLWLY